MSLQVCKLQRAQPHKGAGPLSRSSSNASGTMGRVCARLCQRTAGLQAARQSNEHRLNAAQGTSCTESATQQPALQATLLPPGRRWQDVTAVHICFSRGARLARRAALRDRGSGSYAAVCEANLNSGEATTIFASCGSSGYSAITCPTCARTDRQATARRSAGRTGCSVPRASLSP